MIARFIRGGGVCLFFMAGAALLMMALYGMVDALAPQVAGVTIPGAYDWIGWLMVFALWLGIPLVEAKRQGGIKVTIVYDRIPNKMRKWLDIMRAIMVTAIFAPLCWKGSIYFWDSWVFNEWLPTEPLLPLYPAKLAIAVGAGLVSMICLVSLWRQVWPQFKKS